MKLGKKVVQLEEVHSHLEAHKKNGKKVVHCHGCFDLIHHGHIKHFEAAKEFGDILVVTLTEDQHVNKGPDRPFFNHQIRAENLAALEVIDFVAVNFAATAIPAIQAIQPDFYVKGQDYKNSAEDVSGGIILEREEAEKYGGQLVFTEEVQFSSSKLINQFFDHKDEKAKEFLDKIKAKFSSDHFNKSFDEIKKQKVFIIGDIILDEYQYVRPVGKASKSPTITATRGVTELYAGGVLAVANHVADFVDEVVLISTFGENRDANYRSFIEENLHEKVKWKFVETPNRPTVLKSRIVDQVFRHKLFEVMEIDDRPLEQEVEEQLIKLIEEEIKDSNLSLIADFGHGVLSKEIIEVLVKQSNYLSVNAQTNSANMGYNLLTKYQQCDYFSIDRGEAHLALHQKHQNTHEIQKQLNELCNVKLSSVTLGVNGTSVMSSEGEQVLAPIYNTDVVDTIGAGDAYLSITSLLAANGASLEEIAFVGNAVGSLAVKIVGNKSYIRRTDLLKYLKTLLA